MTGIFDFGLDTPDLAKRYECVSADYQLKAGIELLHALDVQEGERLLDIGCGTGALAEYAADLVGASGSVLGIDPLRERISIARRRARQNLSFEIGNAYALQDIGGTRFDIATLNAVLHWLPEKLGPLNQIERRLADGGRLGIWTIARGHESAVRIAKNRVFARAPYDARVNRDIGGPIPVSADELHDLLQRAGFRNIDIKLVDGDVVLDSASAAIDFIEASSFGNFLGQLPPPLRQRARAEILAELELEHGAGALPLGGKSLLAIARKA